MSNIHFDNQELFCKNNNVPLFAYKSCNHSYPWMENNEKYNNLQTLSEMLVERYGDEEAFIVSSSTHITSCPICSRSWCD